MFKKKQQSAIQSVRPRQTKSTLDGTFRRNNVVVSHRQREMASRQQSVTQRQVDLKRSIAKKCRRNKLITIVVLAVVGLLLYRMQLTSVSVESNASTKLKQDQRDSYESKILTEYGRATVFKQAWLLDTDALSKKILAANPEIERVHFSSSAPLSTSLKADLRFRKAVFTWRDASSTDQFVDGNGVLFEKNLDPTVNTSKLIKIEDQSGTVLDAGTSVLTSGIISFIGQLHGQVTALYGKGASVGKVIIPRSTREVQIQITDQPYVVKFNSTRNLGEQIGELQTLLNHLKSSNVTPAEYIDLRVPHKAFYK